jgi:hypothetical protein
VGIELVSTLRWPGSLDVHLTASLPPGVTLLEAPLASSAAPPTWTFTLEEGEAQTRRLTVAPQEPGPYAIDAALARADAGQLSELAAARVEFEVPVSAEAVLASAISAVALIPAECGDQQLKADATWNLAKVTLTPSSAREAEKSIAAILRAIDDVLAMSCPEAQLAREPLDTLLLAAELAAGSVP